MYKKILISGVSLWLVLLFNAQAFCAIFKNFEEGAHFGNPFPILLKCNTKISLKNGEECETFTAQRRNEEKQVGLSVTFKAGENFILLHNMAKEEKREDRTVFWVFFEGLKKHRDELPFGVQSLRVRTSSYTIKEFLLGQDFKVVCDEKLWEKPVRQRHAAGNQKAAVAIEKVEGTEDKDAIPHAETFTKKIGEFSPKDRYEGVLILRKNFRR